MNADRIELNLLKNIQSGMELTEHNKTYITGKKVYIDLANNKQVTVDLSILIQDLKAAVID